MRAEDSGMVLRVNGHGPDWRYSGRVSEKWSWGAQFRQGEEKSQNTQAYWWKEDGSIGSLRKMALTSPAKNEGSEVFWGWQCVWNCWCKGLAGGGGSITVCRAPVRAHDTDSLLPTWASHRHCVLTGWCNKPCPFPAAWLLRHRFGPNMHVAPTPVPCPWCD